MGAIGDRSHQTKKRKVIIIIIIRFIRFDLFVEHQHFLREGPLRETHATNNRGKFATMTCTTTRNNESMLTVDCRRFEAHPRVPR